MANYSCNSCDDLRNTSSSFVVNGVTSAICTSLKNDTGLNPSSGHNDCTDLDDVNDCLVGNMAEEVEAYDVCDWKSYMKKFVPNVWTTLKSIICAICGIWTNIHNIITRLTRVECVIDTLTRDQDFYVGRDNIVWFNGVTARGGTGDEVYPQLSGNAYTGYMTGSIQLPSDFETNFPNSGITTHGILLYEYRIKLSDFNLKKIYPGNMQAHIGNVGIACHMFVFYPNDNPTKPYASGDTGYATYSVPSGWVYIQVRVGSYVDLANSGNVTLSGVMPVLMNPASFDC